MLPTTLHYFNVTQEQRDRINSRQHDIPIDIHALVEDFGIELRAQNLDNKVSGILDMSDSKQTVIRYNENHGEARQRFTIAHELGHYILHGVTSLLIEDTNNYYSDVTTKMQESQANRFAADVLMPRDLLNGYIRRHPQCTLDELAEVFHVSRVAMAIRLGYPT